MQKNHFRFLTSIMILTLLMSMFSTQSFATSHGESSDDTKNNRSVVPIDWSSISKEELTSKDAQLLEDVMLNSTKYILNTWYLENGYDEVDGYINFGGTSEVHIRGPSMAALGASVAIATGSFDSEVVGLSEEIARKRAIHVITSLAHHHRVNSSSGWGGSENHWQTPLWSFYTGFAGWLLWEDIESQDQDKIRNMIESEADGIPSPRYYKNKEGEIVYGGNTQSEENSSWASLLGLATAMMPNHPNWKEWQNNLVDLLIAAYARPADLRSDQVVNGRVLKEVLNGSNIENDGTVINHGFLHPIYMLAFDQSVNVALTSSLAGQFTPEAAFHNTDIIYNALVDKEFPTSHYNSPGGTIYRDGSSDIYYPEGNDWGTKFPLYFGQADVLANAFGFDNLSSTPASTWENLHIREALAMQERFEDGHSYDGLDESNYRLREERIAQIAGLSYLAKWIKKQGVFHVTDRAYTSDEADPIVGELEELELMVQSLIHDLSRSKTIENGKRNHIETVIKDLQGEIEDARTSYLDQHQKKFNSSLERALTTVEKLKKWLSEQVKAGHITKNITSQFMDLLEKINSRLSTLHKSSDGEVNATLVYREKAIDVGRTFQLSAVIENSGDRTLKNVKFSLNMPNGWTVKRVNKNETVEVEPGTSYGAKYEVTIPQDVHLPWNTAITGQAIYEVRGGEVQLPMRMPVGLEIYHFDPLPKLPEGATRSFSSEDSFVRGGNYADENYFQNTEIDVKLDRSSSYTREAYMKFDLSSLSMTPTAATIKLPVIRVGTDVKKQAVELVKDDWSEKSLTWNTKPEPSGITIAEWIPNTDGLEIDVTKYVKDALENGEDKLSIRIYGVESPGGENFAVYGSNNQLDPNLRPRIIFENTPQELSLNTKLQEVPAGVPVRVTGLFQNREEKNLLDVQVSLEVPDGWTAEAISADERDLSPQEETEFTWKVIPPDDAGVGTHDLKALATYMVDGEEHVLDSQLSVDISVLHHKLMEAFNNIGITDDSNPEPGNLDGSGNSFSARALADVGLTPGAEVTHNGVSFIWPDVPAGEPDNVKGKAAISVSDSGNLLGFIGIGVRDQTGVVTVIYNDGSSEELPVSFPNWAGTPPAEADVVAEFEYRNTQSGPANFGYGYQVFYDEVLVNPDKTVEAVVLPDNSSMHIFSLALE
ncbi:NEW3 domain-containing protein [Salinibacillus xinjiangensis]|uniref:DNRLRE domain-containing protein n=1 Tax=Salinibacillus xinjiangensis TaxID=1229268 RepID=A0A6G1X9G2_9BACI|nr:NEW3 domain-containing protein [Salinibacillus xinjiangensis]MRG87582.1 DNRLRE domain-containing protein [Salinibacillus xinjiangensis]